MMICVSHPPIRKPPHPINDGVHYSKLLKPRDNERVVPIADYRCFLKEPALNRQVIIDSGASCNVLNRAFASEVASEFVRRTVVVMGFGTANGQTEARKGVRPSAPRATERERVAREAPLIRPPPD